MAQKGDLRIRRRDLLWFALAIALPVPWAVVTALGGLGVPHEIVAPLGGLAILGAAFMLSWSCEVAERDIPQSLALLILALVGVLPEYAIDLHFAWTAGQDPSYAQYAVANMTGANRLLIGLGWAAVVVVSCWRGRTDELRLEPKQRLELRFLIWATLYSFLIPLRGAIDIFDAIVLLGLFLAYVHSAMRAGKHDDEELVGPARLIDSEFGSSGRRLWALGLFLFAAWAIWIAAEPFADSLVHIGRRYDVDEFLLVQWIAPLASESPEFVVAILFAARLRGSIGMAALVSSKVNQWTLLVGAIPIAYMLSLGAFQGLPLDERQTGELWLTSAQSLVAAIVLSDLYFTRVEGFSLAALFLIQFALPDPAVRTAFTVLYLGLAAGVLIGSPVHRHAFFGLMLSLPGSERHGGH